MNNSWNHHRRTMVPSIRDMWVNAIMDEARYPRLEIPGYMALIVSGVARYDCEGILMELAVTAGIIQAAQLIRTSWGVTGLWWRDSSGELISGRITDDVARWAGLPVWEECGVRVWQDGMLQALSVLHERGVSRAELAELVRTEL